VVEDHGEAITTREDSARCLVGRSVARQLGLAPGSNVELHYAGRAVTLNVAGIINSGAERR